MTLLPRREGPRNPQSEADLPVVAEELPPPQSQEQSSAGERLGLPEEPGFQAAPNSDELGLPPSEESDDNWSIDDLFGEPNPSIGEQSQPEDQAKPDSNSSDLQERRAKRRMERQIENAFEGSFENTTEYLALSEGLSLLEKNKRYLEMTFMGKVARNFGEEGELLVAAAGFRSHFGISRPQNKEEAQMLFAKVEAAIESMKMIIKILEMRVDLQIGKRVKINISLQNDSGGTSVISDPRWIIEGYFRNGAVQVRKDDVDGQVYKKIISFPELLRANP